MIRRWLSAVLSCGWCGATIIGPESARGRAYCSESHARKALGQ